MARHASPRRTRKAHVVCDVSPSDRRPEQRIDRLTPIRPQWEGSLTWCVCQWPNEVHASTLRPGQGGVCPPPSLQGASTLQQRGSDASTHTDNGDAMTEDKTMVDALARYTGTVMRCPPGRASAPDAKERGRAQFQCVCGHAGTMPYPTLFKRLRRGRWRRKPLRLQCQRCGRVLR